MLTSFCIGAFIFCICLSTVFAKDFETEQDALTHIDYLYSLKGRQPDVILEDLSAIVKMSKRENWTDSAMRAEVMQAEIYSFVADHKKAEEALELLHKNYPSIEDDGLLLRLKVVELTSIHQHGDIEKIQQLEALLLDSISSINDDELKVDVLLKVAYIQYLDSRYDKAIITYNLAYSMAQDTKDQDATGHILVALGNIYSKQRDYQSALNYYTTAMSIAENLEQKFGIAVTAYNVGYTFLLMGNTTEAREYFLKSTQTYDEVGSEVGMAQATNMLGRVAMAEERWSDAIDLFMLALPSLESSGNIQTLFQLYVDLAAVTLNLKQLDSAELYLTQAENLFPQIENKHSKQLFYKTSSGIKAALFQFEEAYSTIQKMAAIQLEIFEQEAEQDTQKYLAEFNAEITEARNSALESENELQALKLESQSETYRLGVVIVVLVLCLFVATAILLFFIFRNRNHFRKLALVDHLTNAPNRRAILQHATLYFEQAKYCGNALAIGILDLDKFKYINDHFGHDVGDAVLQVFAEKCQQSIRAQDCFGRYGGEEWLFVLEQSEHENISRIFERIRALVNDSEIEGLGESYSITFSMGVAVYDEKIDQNVSDLIKRADLAVYKAKQSGRDKLVFTD